jgi:nitrate/nitrite-specific signal transduction histidine kinase
MAETTGLGESGETYIIGQDLTRRTETRFLADLGTTSTILNPEFKVDTVASRSVIAGASGQQSYTDARGIPVMAVWSPITLFEAENSNPEALLWGVIAKIDVSEALASVNQLAGAIGLVIGLAVLVIGVLAVVIGTRLATSFVTPIIALSDTAAQVAAGNMDLQVKIESKDEIGTLGEAFNSMTSQLHDLIGSLESRIASRTKDLATVAEVSTATATILETQALLQAVVDLSKERFGLYHAHIYLLDEAGENLVLTAGAGEPGRIMAAERRSIPLHREQSLVARAAREVKGIIVNDVTLAPDFLPNPLLPDTRAELAVPMIVGGNVIGVYDVQSEQVGRFTDADISVKTTLAAQVATSIQNVRSFEQAKAQAELNTLVNTIGQKIQRSTSVEDTLQTAIRELGLALGASRVHAKIKVNRQDNSDENLN